MDQYTISIGNIIYIDTASEGTFKPIENCNFDGATFDNDLWFQFTAKDEVEAFSIIMATMQSHQ